MNYYFFTDTHDIDSLLFMQKFTKVLFKIPEIFPNTLGGGLEIWASIYRTPYVRVIPRNKLITAFTIFKTSIDIWILLSFLQPTMNCAITTHSTVRKYINGTLILPSKTKRYLRSRETM